MRDTWLQGQSRSSDVSSESISRFFTLPAKTKTLLEERLHASRSKSNNTPPPWRFFLTESLAHECDCRHWNRTRDKSFSATGDICYILAAVASFLFHIKITTYCLKQVFLAGCGNDKTKIEKTHFH